MLKELQLTNFRKFTNLKLSFKSDSIAIVGGNASGKTTVLESIMHLSTGKGTFPSHAYVKNGEKFFRVKGTIVSSRQPPSEIIVFFDASKREKKVLINRKLAPRLAELIGLMPTINLNMNSLQWIWGPVEWRRKQIDLLLAQTDRTYLETLIKHYRLLEQRNKALKTTHDNALFITYGEMLYETSSIIRKYRLALIATLNELIGPLLERLIPDKAKSLELKYVPFDDGDWQSKIEKEKELGYTLWGAQRDQLIWEVGGTEANVFLSRGEGARLALATVIALWLWTARKRKHVTLLADDWEAFQDRKYLEKVPSFLLSVKPSNSSIFIASLNRLKESQWQQIMLDNQ